LQSLVSWFHDHRALSAIFAYGVDHGGVLYLSGTYGTAVGEDDQDFLPEVGMVGDTLSIELTIFH
jgi:hypothetical protein